eukprot:1600953-Pyramimonas_sp.AAC.1
MHHEGGAVGRATHRPQPRADAGAHGQPAFRTHGGDPQAMQLTTGEARHRGAPDGGGRVAASLDVAHLRTCTAQQACPRADLRRAAKPS